MRQIGAILCAVVAWTRRSSGVFFYLVSRGLENFNLLGLLPERALELLDALLRRAACTRQHDVLARADRRRTPGRTGRESRRLVVAAMEWLLRIDPARVVDGAVSGEWLEVQVRMEMRRVWGLMR